jgi:N-acetylglutamate synthase-like GNAT family acetyltransferase
MAMSETYLFRTDKSFSTDRWLDLFRTAEYNDWWTQRNAEACLKHAFLVVTAWQGETVIGTLCVQSDGVNSALIDDVVVHPAHRGRGIGSDLVRRALGELRTLNLRIIQLCPIPGRESFFARFGFSAEPKATVMTLGHHREGAGL